MLVHMVEKPLPEAQQTQPKLLKVNPDSEAKLISDFQVHQVGLTGRDELTLGDKLIEGFWGTIWLGGDELTWLFRTAVYRQELESWIFISLL